MNEQPPEFVGDFFAFILFAIAIFSYIFSKSKTIINLDHFDIGYITDNNFQQQDVTVKTLPINKPKTKPKTQNKGFTDFEKECIDALHSLGMKKSEAITKMNFVLEKYQPKTIQDFISGAFKCEHN
jgi:hypothetical protein